MPAVLHDAKFWQRRSPGARLKIDWRHPLAGALTFCIVPWQWGSGQIVDLVTGVRGSTLGTHVMRPGGIGVADASISAADSARWDFASGQFSVFGYYNLMAVPANGEYPDIVSRAAYVSESNNQGWGLQVRAPNDGQPGYAGFIMQNNAAGFYVKRNTAFSTTAGDHAMMMTSNGSTTYLWQYGETHVTAWPSNVGSGNNQPVTASAVLKLGSASLTTARLYTYFVAGWRTYFPAATVSNVLARDIIMDPWTFFVEESPIAYFLPAKSTISEEAPDASLALSLNQALSLSVAVTVERGPFLNPTPPERHYPVSLVEINEP